MNRRCPRESSRAGSYSGTRKMTTGSARSSQIGVGAEPALQILYDLLEFILVVTICEIISIQRVHLILRIV